MMRWLWIALFTVAMVLLACEGGGPTGDTNPRPSCGKDAGGNVECVPQGPRRQ
jgi:hypothetical protein